VDQHEVVRRAVAARVHRHRRDDDAIGSVRLRILNGVNIGGRVSALRAAGESAVASALASSQRSTSATYPGSRIFRFACVRRCERVSRL
jgi:hypothetical protein